MPTRINFMTNQLLLCVSANKADNYNKKNINDIISETVYSRNGYDYKGEMR